MSGVITVANMALTCTKERVKLSPLGARAWLLESLEAFDLASQRRIWCLAEQVKKWENVESVIPGVTNLLIIFNQIMNDASLVQSAILDGWKKSSEISPVGKVIEIPVCYGGQHAIDLDRVCDHTGLSAQDIIKRHYGSEYTVVSVGSAPGFGYLHGLDLRLATPRKSVPSLNMVKGSVTIGGIQTGVAVLTGPNGWNSIGYADIDAFDVERDPPALMAPGDVVRFLPERVEL